MANETSPNDLVTADDALEPLKVSDDVSGAEMSELDSCNADNTSSVIAVDNAMLMSSVETSAHPPSDDSSVVISSASVNNTVECSATEPVVSTQSELISSSPSKLVIDTSVDTVEFCEVQNADKAESLGSADVDSVAVCETVDKIVCDAVVTESLPLSSENPVTFPAPPTDVGEIISGEDTIEPDGMQLDVAECVEIGDTAD